MYMEDIKRISSKETALLFCADEGVSLNNAIGYLYLLDLLGCRLHLKVNMGQNGLKCACVSSCLNDLISVGLIELKENYLSLSKTASDDILPNLVLDENESDMLKILGTYKESYGDIIFTMISYAYIFMSPFMNSTKALLDNKPFVINSCKFWCRDYTEELFDASIKFIRMYLV